MRSSRAGFTLVEILVVIVIISILAGLTVVGVVAALNASKQSNTETMIEALKGACENYRQRWGDYPPSTLADLKIKVPNEFNNGIESLVACLASQEKGGVLFDNAHEQLLVNVDKDKADKNPTNWYFGDNQLRELSDYWGGTLVYLHFKDYAKPPSGTTKILLAEGMEEQTFKPVKSGATATYLNATTFQIVSAGRDRKLGNEDDVAR